MEVLKELKRFTYNKTITAQKEINRLSELIEYRLCPPGVLPATNTPALSH
jgi:hypothetical protein